MSLFPWGGKQYELTKIEFWSLLYESVLETIEILLLKSVVLFIASIEVTLKWNF